MEINDPNATRDDLWYVTNGLLAKELITGEKQVGDDAFETMEPADVNVAGDPGSGPSYADLTEHLDDAPLANGSTITQRMDAQGNVTNDPSMASHGVTAVHVPESGINHHIANVFWDFMNSEGIVWEETAPSSDPAGRAYITDKLFENPFYGIGFPITEAFWTTVAVAGSPHSVLFQCFERRCLTYTPDNAQKWRLESGNVGQHYYKWRHPAPPGNETVSIYLILLDDNGQTGIPVGCGDSLVDVTVEIPVAGSLEERIEFTLEYLFALEDYDYGESGFVNPLYNSNLVVDEVTIEDGTATVDLLGQIVSAGVCDDPRLIGQIVQTILQFEGIDEVIVNLNGEQFYPPTTPETETVSIYLILLGDDGENGIPVGCEDSLVAVDVEIPTVATLEERIQATLEYLFALDDYEYGEGDLVNPLYNSNLGVDDVTIDDGVVTVDLLGQLLSAGACDDPRLIGQIFWTIKQFEGVEEVIVNLNGEQIYPVTPTETYQVQFMSLNRSGVGAVATLSLTGNQLAVTIDGMHLEPGTHMLEIHGFANGTNAFCPPPGAAGSDGILTDAEGVPAYGQELVVLTPSPVVDETGVLTYEQTLTLNADQLADLGNLTNNTIVIYGMTADSTYDTNLPVACGAIEVATDDEPVSYSVVLGGLNDSGATGMGTLTMNGNVMTVALDASDLAAGTHSLYIRGFANSFAMAGDVARCPTVDDESVENGGNDDGTISEEEGEAAYGDDENGDLAFNLGAPSANLNGDLTLDATFIVDANLVGPLENRVLLLHAGEEATTEPLACGLIAIDAPGLDGEAETYTATLNGAGAVPPVTTDASGYFVARLDPTGTAISWQLILYDVEGVMEARLHEGAPGGLGDPLWTLFDAEGAPVDLGAGQLWSGIITAADLTDPDLTLNDLIALLAGGDVYVNVTTFDYAAGEIRGQVTLVD
jgi:hypothetical protein